MVNSTRQLSAACTIDHDSTDGYAIVAGTLITGVHIGRIYWQEAGSESGLVLEIGNKETFPDDVNDVIETLADHGWQLTDESIQDVVSLLQ